MVNISFKYFIIFSQILWNLFKKLNHNLFLSDGEVQALQRFFISSPKFKLNSKDSTFCPANDKILDFTEDVWQQNLMSTERCIGGKISSCERYGSLLYVCPETVS